MAECDPHTGGSVIYSVMRWRRRAKENDSVDSEFIQGNVDEMLKLRRRLTAIHLGQVKKKERK